MFNKNYELDHFHHLNSHSSIHIRSDAFFDAKTKDVCARFSSQRRGYPPSQRVLPADPLKTSQIPSQIPFIQPEIQFLCQLHRTPLKLEAVGRGEPGLSVPCRRHHTPSYGSNETQRKNKWISEQVSIYFITSEIAYLRWAGERRRETKHREAELGGEKHVRTNTFGIQMGDEERKRRGGEKWRGWERERENDGGSGEEKPQKARTDPVNIAKSVCSACLDRARSIKPRERSFSSPRDPGRAIPTSPMCTLLLPIIRCASPNSYFLPFHRGEFRFCQLKRRSVSPGVLCRRVRLTI